MTIMMAKDAKQAFGRLIGLARAEPVAVAKLGRPIIGIMAAEKFERLKERTQVKTSAKHVIVHRYDTERR